MGVERLGGVVLEVMADGVEVRVVERAVLVVAVDVDLREMLLSWDVMSVRASLFAFDFSLVAIVDVFKVLDYF